MSHFIAAAIRDHLASPTSDFDRDMLANALLAVVDKCERERNAIGNTAWVKAVAEEFELTIARELNVAFPIDQADEARRLLGH